MPPRRSHPWLVIAFVAVLLAGATPAVALADETTGSATPTFAVPPFVYIDPGHGGPYSNANHWGVREKDINLAIALELRTQLLARGWRVGMTRTTDRAAALADIPTWNYSSYRQRWSYARDGRRGLIGGVPYDDLQARCDRANAAGADVFISVHNNGARSLWTRGTESYGTVRDAHGVRLARLVHEEILRATGLRDRGALRKDFYVLRWSNMPAALVEGGFLSNRSEARLLASPVFRAKLAKGIANGIARFWLAEPYRARYPRIAGGGPAAELADASLARWPGGAHAVVLAPEARPTQASVAIPLATALEAPLLLVGPSGLDAQTAAEIARLHPSRVVVIGDDTVMTTGILAEIATAAGTTMGSLERLGGRDASAVSVQVARAFPPSGSGTFVLAREDIPADAATAACYAARRSWPVVLVPAGTAPSVVARLSTTPGSVRTAIAMGSESLITSRAVSGIPRVVRITGSTPLDRNASFLLRFDPAGTSRPVVADVGSDSDCIVAAALASSRGDALALVQPRVLPARTRLWITNARARIAGFTIVGQPMRVPYLMDAMLAKAEYY